MANPLDKDKSPQSPLETSAEETRMSIYELLMATTEKGVSVKEQKRLYLKGFLETAPQGSPAYFVTTMLNKLSTVPYPHVADWFKDLPHFEVILNEIKRGGSSADVLVDLWLEQSSKSNALTEVSKFRDMLQKMGDRLMNIPMPAEEPETPIAVQTPATPTPTPTPAPTPAPEPAHAPTPIAIAAQAPESIPADPMVELLINNMGTDMELADSIKFLMQVAQALQMKPREYAREEYDDLRRALGNKTFPEMQAALRVFSPELELFFLRELDGSREGRTREFLKYMKQVDGLRTSNIQMFRNLVIEVRNNFKAETKKDLLNLSHSMMIHQTFTLGLAGKLPDKSFKNESGEVKISAVSMKLIEMVGNNLVYMAEDKENPVHVALSKNPFFAHIFKGVRKGMDMLATIKLIENALQASKKEVVDLNKDCEAVMEAMPDLLTLSEKAKKLTSELIPKVILLPPTSPLKEKLSDSSEYFAQIMLATADSRLIPSELPVRVVDTLYVISGKTEISDIVKEMENIYDVVSPLLKTEAPDPAL